MSASSGSLARAGSARPRDSAPDPATRATPALDAGACTLSNDLGWALGTVFRGYAKAAHEVLAGLPGGPRGYQVLAAAAADEHGSQLALAQHLGVDRTVMTYLLDDLEAAGLIQRRPDPADRRARRIVATQQGHGTLAELDERLRAAEDQLLSGLDGDEDRQLFRRLLRRLAVHASRSDPARAPCADGTQGGPPLPPC